MESRRRGGGLGGSMEREVKIEGEKTYAKSGNRSRICVTKWVNWGIGSGIRISMDTCHNRVRFCE